MGMGKVRLGAERMKVSGREGSEAGVGEDEGERERGQ